MLGAFSGQLRSSSYGVDDDITQLPTLLRSSLSMSVKSSSVPTPRVPYMPSSDSLSSASSEGSEVLSSSSLLDVVLRLFSQTTCGPIGCGSERENFELLLTPKGVPKRQVLTSRSNKRVLIIGPGFGLERTPRQSEMVIAAGFQIRWVCDIRNPEESGFCMAQNLPIISCAINEFRPHLVVAASKGGHYLMALWESGLWDGPSLMLNVHPNLTRLPSGIPVVLAVGSNDDLYIRSRDDVEKLISTGTPGKCFLYYTDNGGMVQGRFTRFGDKHDMESLLVCDCLPRLMDAAMSPLGPESHLIRSWRDRLSKDRRIAEEWLGYTPKKLRQHWDSEDQEGYDDEVLFEVDSKSEEFHMIRCVFHHGPPEPSAYGGPNAAWAATRIARIHRIENGMQMSGGVEPFYATLKICIEDQNVAFEPGVHTRWAFHGTDAIDSIINNPMSGFQPLVSGARTGNSVWGSGSYFARDAKYAIDGGYSQPDVNGVRQILMCFVVVGISCLGDPRHRGVLPVRQKPHRYDSSVDSLSNPEVFVVQHPSAAYPAYLLTLES